MFDPFTAQEFQEGLRKWDRLQGGETPATTDSEDPHASPTAAPNRTSGADGRGCGQ